MPAILRVGRREVVVPEERHLLLERTVAVHHPEQPSLPRVEDVGRGENGAVPARGDLDVARLADLRVDVVGNLLVVDEAVDRAR